jgi:hypothetical protein
MGGGRSAILLAVAVPGDAMLEVGRELTFGARRVAGDGDG